MSKISLGIGKLLLAALLIGTGILIGQRYTNAPVKIQLGRPSYPPIVGDVIKLQMRCTAYGTATTGDVETLTDPRAQEVR